MAHDYWLDQIALYLSGSKSTADDYSLPWALCFIPQINIALIASVSGVSVPHMGNYHELGRYQKKSDTVRHTGGHNLWGNRVSNRVHNKYSEILFLFYSTERFLNENGQLPDKLPENFLPFGLGRRVCLGEDFAKKELFLIFTWLFGRYTFYKVPGKEEESLMKLTTVSGFVHQPLDGMEVCVKKRYEFE